jgi:hypothetical protein
MARRKLWDEAIEDFSAASRMLCGPLTKGEKGILRRATGCKYGCYVLVNDGRILRALSRLARQKGLAADIVREIARGLVWRIRTMAMAGQVRSATRFSNVFARLSLAP